MIVIAVDTAKAEACLDALAPAAAARASDAVARNASLLVSAVQAQLPARLAARVTAKIETSDTGTSATVATFARVRRYGGRIAPDDIAPQFVADMNNAMADGARLLR